MTSMYVEGSTGPWLLAKGARMERLTPPRVTADPPPPPPVGCSDTESGRPSLGAAAGMAAGGGESME